MTYGEYLEICAGQELIPEEEFGFYSKKAETLLTSYTFGRNRDSDAEELKYAQAELAQRLFENRGRHGVLSESNDGLSVSYENGGDEYYGIAKQWLGESGMMYSGVGRDDN